MRVAILGNPGSGKSTLAGTIATASGATSLDLDTIAWEPGQPAVERAEEHARADVRAFCSSNEAWVVEGCYANLIETALEYTPKLIFMNPGLEACLTSCKIRPWEPHKYASKQEQDSNLQFLLSWVAGYYTRNGPLSLSAHKSCFHAYPGPKLELLSLPVVQEPNPELLAWLR